MDEIRGKVTFIIYKREDFRIVEMKTDLMERRSASFKGSALPEKGQRIVAYGNWQHTKRGMLFVAQRYELDLTEGWEQSLGKVAGIGAQTIKMLREKFGAATPAVLTSGADLKPYVGAKRADALRAAVSDTTRREWNAKAGEYKLSETLAAALYQRFGTETLERVSALPYALIGTPGFTWTVAERIGQIENVDAQSVERLDACLHEAACAASAQSKDVWLEEKEILRRVPELSKGYALLPDAMVRDRIDTCRLLDRNGDLYAAWTIADQERQLANALRKLTFQQAASLHVTFVQTLNDEQVQVVTSAAQARITIVTGGPGTGKTTTCEAVVEMFRANRITYALASPTGSAAQRLSAATEGEASTLHRLIGVIPDVGWRHNATNPLPYQAIIVDECSMMTMDVALALLDAVAGGTRLVFIGDPAQLPPVGTGQVFMDLLKSRLFPIIRLIRVYRQKHGGQLLDALALVRAGEVWDFSNGEQPGETAEERDTRVRNRDLFTMLSPNPRKTADLVIRFVTQNIVARWGANPMSDIMIIAAEHSPKGERLSEPRSLCGVINLNIRLQEALNPPAEDKPEFQWRGGTTFRTGDRVVARKNDPLRDVFNGDMGFISHVSSGRVSVKMADHEVEFAGPQLDDLQLAYCITCHSAQGSQYPFVIVVQVTSTGGRLLSRAWLYTAMSRAQKMCCVMADEDDIWLAVKNQRGTQRTTRLAELLST